MSNETADWYNWLTNTRFLGLDIQNTENSKEWLDSVRDLILNNAKIRKSDTVIDLGCGLGLLGLRVLSAQKGSGNVIFIDSDKKCLDECLKQINETGLKSGYEIVQASCENIPLKDSSVDKVVMRSVLSHIDDKKKAVSEIYRIMKNNALFCMFEPVISRNKRYWQILNKEEITEYELFKDIENKVWDDKTESLFNFDYGDLEKLFNNAGFTEVDIKEIMLPLNLVVTDDLVDSWFLSIPAPDKSSLKDRFLKYVDSVKFDNYINEIKTSLRGKTLNIDSAFALINAKK